MKFTNDQESEEKRFEMSFYHGIGEYMLHMQAVLLMRDKKISYYEALCEIDNGTAWEKWDEKNKS